MQTRSEVGTKQLPDSGARTGGALVCGSVARTLVRTALPLLAGTFAMNAYALTDTWFVSRLGTLPLAAMGFAYPVVMLLTCVAMGIGTAVTALVAHAIGRREHEHAAKLVAHGIALVTGVTVLLSTAGCLLMTTVFTRLGADVQVQVFVTAYMRVWYVGAVFMALPMLGNGILISMGDSKSASGLMMAGPLLNAVLNPILIFGWLGCPALGIAGSALATVVAQALSTLWMFQLLCHKHRLLSWRTTHWNDFISAALRITWFAIPSILTMVLMPVSATVLTRIVSRCGREAVAACGAAQRVEMFAFVIPMALGISLTPFVSQNFGAGRMDRVRTGYNLAARFALLYGSLAALVFFGLAPQLAAVFTDDPKVAPILVSYVRIIAFGYGMMEVHRYCGFVLTGLQRPALTTVLDVIRVLALLIPLSYLGAHVYGMKGLFLGRLTADVVSGCVGLIWVSRVLRVASKRTVEQRVFRGPG